MTTTDTHTPESNHSDEQTHFGFETVQTHEKAERVAQVFDSVAKQYDIMNDVMSFGIHRLWKRFTITLSRARKGNKVLDIAGGTGDLARAFRDKVGEEGHVTCSDINLAMLEVGRDKLLNKGYADIEFVQANAEALPFDDNHFDIISISFGLRNVTDKEQALRSMYRCLKPGGRCLILEFSKPSNPLVAKIYDTYSFSVLPKMGKLIAKDEDSYRYLAESIRMHPDQETLKAMMIDAGFTQVDYHNLTNGVVALHIGIKGY